MKLFGKGQTDVGVVRHHNEDNFFLDNEKELYVVCDGVGGQNAGEVASKMGVTIINEHVESALRNDDEPFFGETNDKYLPKTNRLASAIRLANQVVFESSKSNPGMKGMGSTVVAATRSGSMLCMAHVGDSRIYLVRGGNIMQLTDDHSLVAEQVRQGLITEEDARNSKVKNVITRALGAGEEVDVDMSEVGIEAGDRVLLCTDGLCNMVVDEDILGMVRAEQDLGACCDRLIATANEHGGRDNITVIIAEAQKQGLLARIKNLFR